jgi:hypothetical protein
MSVRVSTSSLAVGGSRLRRDRDDRGSGIPIDDLKEDIRKAKRMTQGIVAVNIMFAIREFMETVMASIEAGVDMIVTGAGFPRRLQDRKAARRSHRLDRLLPGVRKLAERAAPTPSW